MNAKTVTGLYVAVNCDEFAVVSSVECLLHAFATMVKNIELKTTCHFLGSSNALMEQTDVLVAKM